MIYNGVPLDDLLIVERVHNPPLPPIQITTQSAPGANGARFVSKKLSTRSIKVEVVVAGNTRAAYMEMVEHAAQILYTPDAAWLTDLPGDPRRYSATLSGWEMEKLMTIGTGSITFFCADPIAYGDIRAVPLNEDIAFKGALPISGILRQELNVQPGDLLTFALGDEAVRIHGPFSVGDRIMVDMGEGYATRNGVPIADKVDIASSWFTCAPGPARIVTTPATLAQGTFTYRERYL